MLELLRKSFLAGIGAVVVTGDKIREATRALVEEGKLSTEEAEKLTDDLVKSGERQWEDFNTKFQSSMKKWSENVDLARKKELTDLQSRVELLEERLKHLEEARARETEAVEKSS